MLALNTHERLSYQITKCSFPKDSKVGVESSPFAETIAALPIPRYSYGPSRFAAGYVPAINGRESISIIPVV